MAKLLGVDIPKIVATSLPGMYKGTLTARTPGTRTVGNPGGGTNPTSTTYTFKGFASKYVQSSRDLVRVADFTVLVLGATLKPRGRPPRPGDKIQLTGDPQLGSRVATIIEQGVDRDPAGATYTCYVKA